MQKSTIESIVNNISANKKDGSVWQYVYGFRRKSGHVTKISTSPVTTDNMLHFPTVDLQSNYVVVKTVLDTDIGAPQPIVEFIDYDDITEVLVFNKDGVVSDMYKTTIHYVANVRGTIIGNRWETIDVQEGNDSTAYTAEVPTYDSLGFTTPAPEGKEFDYWSTSPNRYDKDEAQNYYPGEHFNGVFEDLYLYAIWKKSTGSSSGNNSGSGNSGSGGSGGNNSGSGNNDEPEPPSQDYTPDGNGTYNVPINDLDGFLNTLPNNDGENGEPYDLNVTDLTNSDIIEEGDQNNG